MVRGVLAGFLWMFCIVVTIQSPQAASNAVIQALQKADAGQHGQAQQIIAQVHDPQEQDTYLWFKYANGKNSVDFYDGMKFIEGHKDWPLLNKIKANMEGAIPSSVPNPAIVKWFSQNPPATAEGMIRYLQAMMAMGQAQKLRPVLQNWWETASMSRDQQRYIYSQYKIYLTRENHIRRMNDLLDKRKHDQAIAMGDAIGSGYGALARARAGLQKNRANVNGLINAVPARLHSGRRAFA